MEYKPEHFVLNKLCQFRNRDAEADFMDYDKAVSLNIVRTMMLIVGLVFALFIFSDLYFYRDNPAFVTSLILRAIGLLITIAAFCNAGRFKRYAHTLRMLTVTQLTIFVIYLVNMHLLRATQIYLQFMTAMLFIMAIFLIPNVWKNSIIGGGVIFAGYMIFRVHSPSPVERSTFIMHGIYLLICLVCCAIFLFGREASRRKQFAAEKRMEYLSITDSLTGIYNRGRFEHVLGLWIKNTRRAPLSMILFDIDNFKAINDRFGHTMGDQVLLGITEIVSAHIRDQDMLARWGGEEFVILFSNTHLEKASELAERLRRMVEITPFATVGKVTISIGAAESRQGETFTEFVSRADAKMYEAKRSGKNRVMA